MKWKKLGRIIQPTGKDWMVTHAQNPFSLFLDEDRINIHFAGRTSENRAHGGHAIFNLKEMRTESLCETPSLGLGSLGAFDDCGAMPSCIVTSQNRELMYYTGWSKAVETPFTFYIGLATKTPDGEYQRYSLAPVLGRNHFDPYLTASPWVLYDNSLWKMWYVSGQKWSYENGQIKHSYNIKYAESNDGISWTTNSDVCIDFEKEEYAIARPTVRIHDGLFKMWYCYRGGQNRYEAGYAESNDGKKWTRMDDIVGITTSKEGWDSEMICYPFVFEYKGQEYMLYNGNGYGSTGVGIAVREE